MTDGCTARNPLVVPLLHTTSTVDIWCRYGVSACAQACAVIPLCLDNRICVRPSSPSYNAHLQAVHSQAEPTKLPQAGGETALGQRPTSPADITSLVYPGLNYWGSALSCRICWPLLPVEFGWDTRLWRKSARKKRSDCSLIRAPAEPRSESPMIRAAHAATGRLRASSDGLKAFSDHALRCVRLHVGASGQSMSFGIARRPFAWLAGWYPKERDRPVEPIEIDFRQLRGILAMRMISHTQFATACELSRTFASRVLTGHPAGELARIKIARGMRRLGIGESEARCA
jgi:hypothetical protein